jgi:excisionase family DNA binding protein
MGYTSEWVSLGEAAQIVGVHPATIRKWAEQGELPFRRTPGGHRRFRRSDLNQWLETYRPGQPAEAQIIVQNTLSRVRREIGDKQKLAQQEWYTKLSPEARETMRQQGLRLMDDLIRYLANPAAEAELQAARQIGKTYGDLLRAQNLALSKTLEGYFYFSNFLLEAVIQLLETGSTRSPVDWGNLLRQVIQFTREILTGLIAAYEE